MSPLNRKNCEIIIRMDSLEIDDAYINKNLRMDDHISKGTVSSWKHINRMLLILGTTNKEPVNLNFKEVILFYINASCGF